MHSIYIFVCFCNCAICNLLYNISKENNLQIICLKKTIFSLVQVCFMGFNATFNTISKGLGGSMSQVVVLPNNSYKPITNTTWVRARLCKLQKGCTRLAAASDKVYQLLAHGRWFSPGTPASSTTNTGRHDIAEILLKVALNIKNQSINTISTILWPSLLLLK